MTYQYGDFVIQKGVPLPRALTRAKYPFRLMDVGESFFVPCEARMKGGESVTVAAHAFGRKNGMKFATRMMNENGTRGVRIWRIV
jgi:hypothetical protein